MLRGMQGSIIMGMSQIRKLRPIALLLIAGFLASLPASLVQARANEVTPPPGFELVDSGPAVELYRKDYPGGTPDYVQVINLSGGARLTLLHGPIASPGEGLGAFGGDSPSFSRQTLQQYWDSFAAGDSQAFCLVNGTFFSTGDDPTPLAFPLKKDGKVVSQGYGAEEYPNQKWMLELWPDRAQIRPLSADALASSSAPQIVAGLSEDADKDPSALVGRTLAGVLDADGDGQAETVLIFTSKTSRQADSAGVLRAFGADQVMMLDGGESAQMICRNNPYVYSNRSLPQVIGISSGDVQPLAVKVVKQTDWPVLVEGETVEIELTLRNEGSETWLPGEVALVNLRNDWGAGSRLELLAPVPPGETVTFKWTSTAFPRRGVFLSEWDIARGGRLFASKPIIINVIVLPQELADKKTELEEQVREWGRQQLENIEQLVLDWIQDRVREGFDKICPAGASLPLLVAAAGVWHLARRKR